MPMSDRRKLKDAKDKITRQFVPGTDSSSARRKKIMEPDKRLIKIRNVPDDNIVTLLGHRFAGGLYSSIHPPIMELMEKYDPIKELVVPSPGAEEGDRMKFVGFSDSLKAPIGPILRQRMYFNRFRGVDVVPNSEMTLLEMRERDVEAAVKPLIETEAFDTVRTTLRSIDPQGSTHRLDELEVIFDPRRRSKLDLDSGYILYHKDMDAKPLDKPISLGFAVDKQDLSAINVMYRGDRNAYKNRSELFILFERITHLRILGGFKPDLVNDK
jgi:methyl-coenzyme M reductase gamma subunit